MAMTRRDFLAAPAAAPLAAAGTTATATAPGRPMLCIFSKHMPKYGWAELGVKAKEAGFDGVDLTVRPGGHVAPERAAEDLPRAVEAIRKAGVEVPMITTGLISAADPAARPTLEAMKKAGVPLFKTGYWRYRRGVPSLKILEDTRKLFLELVDLSRAAGVTIGLHNHSADYVGCSVWDYRELLAGVDPKDAGYYYDPGHAVVEGGGHGWRVSLDLVSERLRMAAIKDFHWEKTEKGWRVRWRPLGEGMVQWGEFFKRFAEIRFTGPLSLHVEYPGGEEPQAIAADLAFMKNQVAAAYGA
jgi:sugar phosphate isomerase/epimerase